LVAVDGQRQLAARPDLPVRLAIAKRRLSLAQTVDYSHFAVVRAKLRWSGGFAENKGSG
jgi:NAD+ kinase